MSLKRVISLGLCAALTAGLCATAQAETPAERRIVRLKPGCRP